MLHPQAVLPPSVTDLFGAPSVSQASAGHLHMRILVYKGGPGGSESQPKVTQLVHARANSNPGRPDAPCHPSQHEALGMTLQEATPPQTHHSDKDPSHGVDTSLTHGAQTQPDGALPTCQKAWGTSGTPEGTHQPQPLPQHSPVLPRGLPATSYSFLPVHRKNQHKSLLLVPRSRALIM